MKEKWIQLLLMWILFVNHYHAPWINCKKYVRLIVFRLQYTTSLNLWQHKCLWDLGFRIARTVKKKLFSKSLLCYSAFKFLKTYENLVLFKQMLPYIYKKKQQKAWHKYIIYTTNLLYKLVSFEFWNQFHFTIYSS